MVIPLIAYRLGLRIKEVKEVYEGEVTELTPAETENPLGGMGKSISHVVIGLKTAKGSKQLKLDPSIYEGLQKEKVSVGDVIYIEANSGAVKVDPCFNCSVWVALMHLLPSLTWKLKLMYLFLKVKYTRKKKLFKM